MRGKNILLVVMLLSIAIAGIGFARSPVSESTKMLVEPSMIQGNPGDLFWVDINIEKVVDLYAYEFKLGYVAGTRVIGALEAVKGGFLYGPQGTGFAYAVNGMEGYIHVGETIQGNYSVGISGDGILAKIQFKAGEGGESFLHLYDIVLLDYNLNPMPCQTRDGYYDGPNVELVMINLGARAKDVGDTQTFDVKVDYEDAQGPDLTVMARIDTVRAEDGKTTTMWSGQSYEYPPIREPIDLYVDGYTAERQQWTEVGTSPFLDAPDDGSYIEGSANAAQHRWFTFEDFELGDSIIDFVQLEVYCEGPYNEAVDYDIYYSGFNWLGSWYGTDAGRVWQDNPRWTGWTYSSEREPALLTEAGINDAEIMVYFYDPDGYGGAGNIIDSARLHIEFKMGRAPEEPVVDGYTGERQQWTEVGTSPFLDAPDDGSYIEGSTDAAQHRWFTFEDVDVGDSVIDYVQLWGYCNGPYNEAVDYDVYATGFVWLGSLYATGAGPEWVTPRWVGTDTTSDLMPELLSEEGINALEVLVYFYDPEGYGGAGNIVDCLKLEVTFKADRVNLPLSAPTFTIIPAQMLELEVATWKLEPEDVGTYTTTITVYYSFGGIFYNAGHKKVITESWRVKG